MYRNESEQDSVLRKSVDMQGKARARANESEQDSVVHKSVDVQCKARARANESELKVLFVNLRISNPCLERGPEKQSRQLLNINQKGCLMATVRASAKPIDVIIEEFEAKVKIGPDYVCISCHRMSYKHTYVQYKPSNTLKLILSYSGPHLIA